MILAVIIIVIMGPVFKRLAAVTANIPISVFLTLRCNRRWMWAFAVADFINGYSFKMKHFFISFKYNS